MSETISTSTAATERGGSQSDLRRYNERVVLGVIRSSPGTFNAELSRRTGLAAQTISVILRSLDDQGLIRRGPVLRGRRGQPATPITLNPEGAYAMGAEIGWRHMSVVAVDLSGEVLGRTIREYAGPDPQTIATQVHEAILTLSRDLPDNAHARFSGIGLAVPSGLDARGWSQNGPAGGGWDTGRLASELGALCQCPIVTVNDGTAACRAEAAGPSAGGANLAYLFIGTAIGAGFVLNGRTFDGPRGNAANLGSLIVPSGQGAAVTADGVASIAALDARLAAAGHAGLVRLSRDWDWHGARPVVEAWADDAAMVIAHVIANTAATIEFERMVIDSALPPDLLDLVVARVHAALSRLGTPGFALPHLALGRYGLAAAAIGAASLPLHQAYFTLEAG